MDTIPSGEQWGVLRDDAKRSRYNWIEFWIILRHREQLSCDGWLESPLPAEHREQSGKNFSLSDRGQRCVLLYRYLRERRFLVRRHGLLVKVCQRSKFTSAGNPA